MEGGTVDKPCTQDSSLSHRDREGVLLWGGVVQGEVDAGEHTARVGTVQGFRFLGVNGGDDGGRVRG